MTGNLLHVCMVHHMCIKVHEIFAGDTLLFTKVNYKINFNMELNE